MRQFGVGINLSYPEVINIFFALKFLLYLCTAKTETNIIKDSMTEDQKKKLSLHVVLNKRVYGGDSIVRWLDDDQTIEFTSCLLTSNNAEFRINNDQSWIIWYTQLSNFGLTDNLELCVGSVLFKDEKEEPFYNLSAANFWKKAKGKKFRVDIYSNVPYTFNNKSSKWNSLPSTKYIDAINFIKKCIEEGQYEKIGDLLKTSALYHLTEI